MNNKKIPLLYLGCLSGMSLFSFDLFQPALPAITQQMNSSHAAGQFTLSMYLLVFGVAQLLWGPAVDHFGRTKTLYVSLTLFVIASLICMLAGSMEVLIFGRALQGFAACCPGIMGYSAARDYDNPVQRAKLISYISMIVSVSPIFAPAIGAFVFKYFDWQANFLIMAVYGSILLLSIKLCVYESPRWQPAAHKFNIKAIKARYAPCWGNKGLWLGIIIICAAFSNVMILVINAAWIIIGMLRHKPETFAYLFALNGFSMIIGNYIGIHFRERFSLIASIIVGSILMMLSGTLIILLNTIYELSIITIAPALLIPIGCSFIMPAASSIALTDFAEHPSSATAVMNSMRMLISASVGAGIGIMVHHNFYAFGAGILICGCVSLLTGYFYQEK